MAEERDIGASVGAVPLDPAGVGAALDALDAEGRLDIEAEQLDLLDSSPLLASNAELQPVRGKGRPPGSLNKTTDDWRAYFLRHYRSPLFALGDLIAADPVKLQRAIIAADKAEGVEREVSLLDVINLQRGAADGLMPYLHRKQPIAIDAGEDKTMPFIQFFQLMAAGGGQDAQAAAIAGEMPASFELVEGEVAGEKSHDASADAPSD